MLAKLALFGIQIYPWYTEITSQSPSWMGATKTYMGYIELFNSPDQGFERVSGLH